MWRFAGIEPYDITNGLGVGVTLFTQGCARHCRGCHNPQTWAFDGGIEYTPEVDKGLFDIISDPNIVRLTISGGEPLHMHNIPLVSYLVGRTRFSYPEKKIWLFTGMIFDDIRGWRDIRSILSMCDILVDGEFIFEKKCLSLPFRGSRNQRIIDVQSSLNSGYVVELDLNK